MINDAKSTNWEATKTALSSFDKEGEEMILVIGGQLRGENDSILPHLESLLRRKVEFIFSLIGDSAHLHGEELSNKGIEFLVFENVSDVIEFYREKPWSIFLFSPAFPSFDQYKNYLDRGRSFESYWELD